MKRIFALAFLPLLAVPMLGAGEASAKGCIKGAVVGGIAGHVVGHGLAGAVGGCVIGRHNAKIKAQQQKMREEQTGPSQSPTRAY